MLRHVSRNLAAKEARHNGPGQKAIFCGDEEHWTERGEDGYRGLLAIGPTRAFSGLAQDVTVPSRKG